MPELVKHRVECIAEPRSEDPDPASLIPPEGAEDLLLEGRASQRLILRRPVLSDASEVWALVQEGGELDPNSPYAYLLLCSDFADCGMVMRDGGASDRADEADESEAAPSGSATGRMVGFVLGYRPPARPDTLFVWQIGVHADYRGQGMGRRLLDRVVDRAIEESGVTYLEATVTPSNTPSRMLFTRFAVDRSVRIHESRAFRASDFPAADENGNPHEDEIRLRIGPLRRHGV